MRRLSAHLRQFAHGAHTAGADVYRALDAIDLNTTMLYIENETAARAALRVADIVAMHWLASTDITTT